jgi:hypothetical protein
MTADEFAKQLKATASNPEEMWLYVAMLVFFPVALAMLLMRMLNKGASSMLAQSISNSRQQFIYDNQLKALQDQQQLKMQQEYKAYMAQREKRLLAYEKKVKALAPPETSAPVPDAPAQ